MRRPLIAMALCAGAAGCASRVPVAGADRLAPIRPPLEARLNPPMRGALSYWVSRPAYVAIFELIPEHGVSLVYPTFPWQESRADAGSRWALLTAIPGRWLYFAGSPARYRPPMPRYLYLVASERPLRIAQIQRNPMLLRRAMNVMSYTVFNPRLTTDAIDRIIMPDVNADDWVSDLYVLWPEFTPRSVPRFTWALRASPYGIPVAVLPDSTKPDSSSTKPDSSRTPGDSSKRPRRPEAEEPPGIRSSDGDWIRKRESDGSKAKGPKRGETRTIAEAEEIDVPWSPPARATAPADRRDARDRSREAARSGRDAWPREREADERGRRATESDAAWRETREREAAPSRGEARGAEQPVPTRGESVRNEPRPEPPRAEPRAEPPRAEPRSQPPRAEPPLSERGSEQRGAQRGEPPRQPPSASPPPGSSG